MASFCHGISHGHCHDFAEPRGSKPGLERPVVVMQGDALNRASIPTVVVLVLTSNVRLALRRGPILRGVAVMLGR